MTFDDLTFRKSNLDPGVVHAVARFGNGYGASVVGDAGTLGLEQGRYGLAVLKGDEIICTSVWDADAAGTLSKGGVSDWLKKIEAL